MANSFYEFKDVDNNSYIININKITHVEFTAHKRELTLVNIYFYDSLCTAFLEQRELSKLKSELNL